jgi:hypothetical protein
LPYIPDVQQKGLGLFLLRLTLVQCRVGGNSNIAIQQCIPYYITI